MKDMDYLKIAGEFLDEHGIGFVNNGRIGYQEDSGVEVIFPVPETLDSKMEINNPPDIRVWVDRFNGDTDIIFQM
jgi:hypothetical protein